MPADSGIPRSSRPSRPSRSSRLPLTPSVTTVRRGSHRPRAAVVIDAPKAASSTPAADLSLLRSARGVRLDRSR